MRILSLVFSFSTPSKVCLSFSNSKHFLESSSWTLLSSPRISTSLSDCAMTASCILCSSASCQFLWNCSSSNLSLLLPILKRLKILILFISFVVQYGSNSISSPSLHLCKSYVTYFSFSRDSSLPYLSAFCSSVTFRFLPVEGWLSKEMVKSIFLLRSQLILSLQQLMISRKSFLAASLVLIIWRCLTFEKMDLSSSFSFSSFSIFLSYWICTTFLTLSSSPFIVFSTIISLSQAMVFSCSSLVTLLRYSASSRFAFLVCRCRISADCSFITLFFSFTASIRISWYCEKVSILFLNSFSVNVKSSLFIQLTQSQRSGTVMTKPQPDERRSTLETLFRNLFMNACRKESLYCWLMKVFLYAIRGLEQLVMRCTRGIKLVFIIRFGYCFGILYALRSRRDSLRILYLSSSRRSLTDRTYLIVLLYSSSFPPSFLPMRLIYPLENCILFSYLNLYRFSQRL